MAHYDVHYGGDDMTCQDCIHDCKKENICDNYADRDGLYSNGTWHCPRCGKEVSAWGLCNECENVYLTHESVGNALDALDSWESVSK